MKNPLLKGGLEFLRPGLFAYYFRPGAVLRAGIIFFMARGLRYKGKRLYWPKHLKLVK